MFEKIEKLRSARRIMRDIAADLEALRPWQDVVEADVYRTAWVLALGEFSKSVRVYEAALREGVDAQGE